MDFWKVLLLLAAAAAAVTAAAVNLTRKVGEDVTLSLGDRQLKPGDLVIWSYGPETGKEHRLFDIDIGNHDGPTKRDQFDLDPTTGALTVKHLSATDSAVYYGQIINGNGTNRIFNLMVQGPDPIHPIHPIHPIQPIHPTAEPQQPANIGIIIGAVVVVVVVVVFICLLIAFIVKKKNICSTDTIV